MARTTLDDAAIRAALHRTLIARALRSPTAVAVDEFSLNGGDARVDLVVVNGHLSGYEIKSDRDTLARLPEQMRRYNAVLDRVTLIAGWRHAASAMRAVPQWWGVRLAELGPRGGVRFTTLRVGESNPAPNAWALAALLRRDETVAALEKFDRAAGTRSQPIRVLRQRLAACATIDELRSMIRAALKRRLAAQPGGRSG